MAQITTLFVAGHEPTAGLVSNGMLALLRQHDQWGLLQEDRSLLRNAISELLRYDGPNQVVRRVSMPDMDFATPNGTARSPSPPTR